MTKSLTTNSNKIDIIQLDLIKSYKQLSSENVSKLLVFYNSPALLQSLNTDYTYTINDLQLLYNNSTSNILRYLIRVNDELVGIADLTLEQLTDYVQPTSSIYSYEIGLSILAEGFQNKGYGKRCLRLLEQEVLKCLIGNNYKISCLKAECLTTNLPACRLYSSMGYSGEQSQIINPFSGSVEDVIVFTKPIEAINNI